MSEPKRTALYLRISTDEEHQPWSLEAQRERLEAYCASQSWSVAKTYCEQASGATLERPQLQQALTDARLGRFDILLVVRVDRLSRNLGQLAHFADVLEEAGVTLVSATEPFDTSSPPGRMLFQMLGSFAEFERALIVDRVKAGIERRAKSGRWIAGRVPFGYRRSEETKELEPDPLRAPVVEEIFRLYAEERLGTKAIAARLNDRGERAASGGLWGANSIVWLLRNPAYLGLVSLRGEHFEGNHPALIDGQLFEAAQQLLAERGENPRLRRGNASEYLVSGLVRCRRCGCAYVGMSANGNGGRYEYYACRGRLRHGRDYCDNDHLPRRALENAVVGQLLLLLSQSEPFERAWEEAQAEQTLSARSAANELKRIQSLHTRLEQRRGRYFQAFEDGTLEPTLCQERLAELGLELDQLAAQMSTLTAEVEDGAPSDFPASVLDEGREALARAHDEQDAAKAKALLRIFVGEIGVMSHSEIEPTYQLTPLGEPVRTTTKKVGGTGIEPVTSCL